MCFTEASCQIGQVQVLCHGRAGPLSPPLPQGGAGGLGWEAHRHGSTPEEVSWTAGGGVPGKWGNWSGYLPVPSLVPPGGTLPLLPPSFL